MRQAVFALLRVRSIFTTVFITVAGAGLLTFVQADFGVAAVTEEGQGALQAAEAGVQAARQQLISDNDARDHYDGGANDLAWSYCYDIAGCTSSTPTSTGSAGRWVSVDNGGYANVTILATGHSPETYKVISDGHFGNARRKVEAILRHDPSVSSPAAYFSRSDITLTGSSSVDGVGFFALGNVNFPSSLFSLGGTADRHFGKWAQTSGEGPYPNAASSYPNTYNRTPRPSDLVGVGAQGFITGTHKANALEGTRSFDSDSTPYRVVPDYDGSALPESQKIAFPFHVPTAADDRQQIDVLRKRALALEQANPGVRYYIDSNPGNGVDDPGLPIGTQTISTWPTGSTYETVRFYEYEAYSPNNQVSYMAGPSGCATTANRGVIVVQNGDMVYEGNRRFDGAIFVRAYDASGNLMPDAGRLLMAGQPCLYGYANTSGDQVVTGNLSAGTVPEPSTLSAFRGTMEVVSQRELHDTTPPGVNATVLETPIEDGWHYRDVTLELLTRDNEDGSGVASLTYSASGAKNVPVTTTGERLVRLLISEEGETTVAYSAQDHAGNTSQEGTLTVKIDKTAPEATIDSGPDGLTNDGTPAFTFGGSDNLTPSGDLRYSYRVDDLNSWSRPSVEGDVVLGGDYGLAHGPHTLYVKAFDNAGNESMNTAERSFFVDDSAPRTTITAGPSGLTRSDAASFSFSTHEPADFQCRLDGADFAPCTSPVNYEDLIEGQHTFRVRATDLAGNIEPVPAQVRWTVDTAAPRGTATLNDGRNFTDDALVNLALSAEDPHPGSGLGAVSISNDGVHWSWYPYVKNISWILHGDDGPKTVRVRYHDEAGNFSTTRDSILLDKVSPSGRVDINGGDIHTRSRNVELTLEANDPSPASGVASVCFRNRGGEWSAWRPYSVTESWQLSAGAGEKTLHAKYRDSTGNVSEKVLDTISYSP